MVAGNNSFQQVYLRLHEHYGHQHWWPAEDEFEIIIGAILTQNTSWSNVEKAIDNLKQQGFCNPHALAELEADRLAQLIRSSGYFNQKARRLKTIAGWYLEQGGLSGLRQLSQSELRQQLLSLNGVGDETADDICLYAFNHPLFVIDAYTRRLFSRLSLLNSEHSYSSLQQLFHQHLSADAACYQQYHALIVAHAKQHCRKKPVCALCPLEVSCEYGQSLH
jgi:endonuclease III related protein